jgi:hypothetical protein
MGTKTLCTSEKNTNAPKNKKISTSQGTQKMHLGTKLVELIL